MKKEKKNLQKDENPTLLKLTKTVMRQMDMQTVYSFCGKTFLKNDNKEPL